MSDREELALEQWQALVGQEIGVSPWMTVTQAQIDAFAEVTGDRQFIHVDPERAAKESPYGTTIAHGFLTLSLLSPLARSALPGLQDAGVRINYGFDKVRFIAPVPSGSRIRGRFKLLKLELRTARELTLKYEVTVEIEGSDRPALAAEWLSRVYLSEDAE